jgi:uncharacterized protein (DUF1697 family)
MKVWIALLRGINVGGNLLPMKELAAVMTGAGCREVRTYIQSGNVVFRHSIVDAGRLAARLQNALSKGRSFEPRVLVLDPTALKKALASNPFRGAEEEPRYLHAFFLAERPPSPDLAGLERLKAVSESFALKGNVLYMHTPDGFGKSKLAARAERCLGVDATARNWRTLGAVLDLANSLE